MQPNRPRISPKVLHELAQKVHRDDPSPEDHHKMHALLERFQNWGILLFGGAWIMLVAAAPFLLLLLLFRVNFTGQWLIALAWLASSSFVAVGFFLIAVWLEQSLRGSHPSTTTLLGGIALLVSTISGTFLIWQGTNDTIPPLVTVSVSVLLGLLFIGWGMYRLMTERQTRLIFRWLFLIAMLWFAISLVINVVSLKYEVLGIPPEIYRTLRTIRSIFSPLGWVILLLSNLGRLNSEKTGWERRNIILFVVVVGAMLVVLFLQSLR